MAKRYGDKTAERKALDRLIELGVKREDLRQSIKRAHPLGAIPLKDRAAFLRALTPRERELLEEAIDWYEEIYND
mgnify:CR=1 FL=1